MARTAPLEHKAAHLEAFLQEGLQELMRHDDALYSRVDQKLDRYRREAGELTALLGERAVERAGGRARAAPALADRDGRRHYLELERRYRGTPAEIRERLAVYLPLFAGKRDVLDLGCGRGEALALLGEHGLAPPASTRARRWCGAAASRVSTPPSATARLLRARPAASLDGVVSFHVVEHLPAATLERLVRVAWRALRPGGVLVLETPNPLSISRRRPPLLARPHPPAAAPPRRAAPLLRAGRLRLGRDPLLHPFAPAERLPEIDLAGLAAQARARPPGQPPARPPRRGALRLPGLRRDRTQVLTVFLPHCGIASLPQRGKTLCGAAAAEGLARPPSRDAARARSVAKL